MLWAHFDWERLGALCSFFLSCICAGHFWPKNGPANPPWLVCAFGRRVAIMTQPQWQRPCHSAQPRLIGIPVRLWDIMPVHVTGRQGRQEPACKAFQGSICGAIAVLGWAI
jgi:hypothetical protein